MVFLTNLSHLINTLFSFCTTGRILEYDSPNNLLKDESSAFSKLVMEFVGRTDNVN
jgi:hypothetical protein